MPAFIPQEVIRAKRDGRALADDDIAAFVAGIGDGTLSEGQAAAMAMAICLNGMSGAECVALTRAMTDSGRILEWPDLGRPILDKHSTGGVGDKVSLVLAPIMAACGAAVPMISGRGLGHTGGTLDKLDAIPGYDTAPDIATFRRIVADAGCAIVGPTDDLAPADRRLYAIRDVTATIDSVPLITASILSKKLAAGLDGLVMDVKTGNGAFMTDLAAARGLADSIVTTAQGAGLPARALITDMNQVLGDAVGNALEVEEAVAYLTGVRREPRLHEVVAALCRELLLLGGLTESAAAAQAEFEKALDSGAAAESFQRMVAASGGPADFADRLERHLPRAPVVAPVERRWPPGSPPSRRARWAWRRSLSGRDERGQISRLTTASDSARSPAPATRSAPGGRWRWSTHARKVRRRKPWPRCDPPSSWRIRRRRLRGPQFSRAGSGAPPNELTENPRGPRQAGTRSQTCGVGRQPSSGAMPPAMCSPESTTSNWPVTVRPAVRNQSTVSATSSADGMRPRGRVASRPTLKRS